MEYLINRSTDKGNSMKLTLDALRHLHRFADTKKTTRGDGVFYSKAPPKTASLSWRVNHAELIPDLAEEKKRQHVLLSTPSSMTSQEQADCYNSKSDSDRCIEITHTPHEHDFLMDKKYGHWKWKEMKMKKALL